MRLPTYDEISRDEEQLNVYETPFDESLFVVGPPGSGKTVLAVHRAQMLTNAGVTVVLITYSRMLRRLIAQLTEGRVQAQTMHRFVSTCYRQQTSTGAPSTEPYIFDWNAMFTILVRRGVTPNPTHVIVDEGQDLPKEFFRYLRDFVAATITVFADEDQALTEDRSTPHDIKEVARLDNPVLLSANHRNRPEIARVAEFFHTGHVPVPEVHRASVGRVAPRGPVPRERGGTTHIELVWNAGRPYRRCRSKQQYWRDAVFPVAESTRRAACRILHK